VRSLFGHDLPLIVQRIVAEKLKLTLTRIANGCQLAAEGV
jgi:hypothetical protein